MHTGTLSTEQMPRIILVGSRDFRTMCIPPNSLFLIENFLRAGKLEEAEQFLQQHIREPNAVVLTSIIGACRQYVRNSRRTQRLVNYGALHLKQSKKK